jgi:hypothetical protein
MADIGGYVYIIDDKIDVIGAKISSREFFTDHVNSRSWSGADRELFLIIDNEGYAFCYALARKSTPTSTGQTRIQFIEYVVFPASILADEILSQKNIDLNYFLDKMPINEENWNLIRDYILRLFPDLEEQLIRIEKNKISSDIIVNENSTAIYAQERDAINLSLRISGFSENEITRTQSDFGNTTQRSPFILSMLENSLVYRIREDTMIIHDLGIFGDFRLIGKDVRGFIELENKTSRLTVYNVNRNDLEKTLGVDLIYYMHKYKSFVMVQYKRMKKEGTDFIYRPDSDKNFMAEVSRMHLFDFELVYNLPYKNHTDYRLNSKLFFFKLCPVEQVNPKSPEMIEGMYFPLDFWNCNYVSNSAIGSHGGIRISRNNTERYLNNTDFINLYKHGWIGTQIINQDLISKIIYDSLNKNHSLILAIKK